MIKNIIIIILFFGFITPVFSQENITGSAKAFLPTEKEKFQYSQIMKHLKDSSLTSRNDAQAYYIFGMFYGAFSQHAEALECYRKAVEIDPELGQAYVGIGSSFIALGKPQESIQYLLKAIQICPDSADGYQWLGLAYSFSSEKSIEAISFYNRALQIDPKFYQAYLGLGNLYINMGRYKEAIDNFQKVIGLAAYPCDAYLGMATAYSLLKNNKQARLNFLKAIELLKAKGDYKGAKSAEDILTKLGQD